MFMLFLTDHYLQFSDHISLLLNEGANGREANKQMWPISFSIFTHGLTLIKPKKQQKHTADFISCINIVNGMEWMLWVRSNFYTQ